MNILNTCTRQLKIEALYVLSLEKEQSYYCSNNPLYVQLQNEITATMAGYAQAGRTSIVKELIAVYLEQYGDRGDFAGMLARI